MFKKLAVSALAATVMGLGMNAMAATLFSQNFESLSGVANGDALVSANLGTALPGWDFRNAANALTLSSAAQSAFDYINAPSLPASIGGTVPAGAGALQVNFTQAEDTNQTLVSSTVTVPRNFTMKVKFAVTQKTITNDIRLGVYFPTVHAQAQRGYALKIGQGDVQPATTKDLQSYVTTYFSGLTANTTYNFGASMTDDTDYNENQWYTAEFQVNTSDTAAGTVKVLLNGTQVGSDLVTKADSAAAFLGARFFVHGWGGSTNETLGTVLVDEVEFLDSSSGVNDWKNR